MPDTHDVAPVASEIEGGLEAAVNFSSLEECEASGGFNCAEVAAIMEANSPDARIFSDIQSPQQDDILITQVDVV